MPLVSYQHQPVDADNGYRLVFVQHKHYWPANFALTIACYWAMLNLTTCSQARIKFLFFILFYFTYFVTKLSTEVTGKWSLVERTLLMDLILRYLCRKEATRAETEVASYERPRTLQPWHVTTVGRRTDGETVCVSAHHTQVRTPNVLILSGLYIKIKFVPHSKRTPSGL